MRIGKEADHERTKPTFQDPPGRFAACLPRNGIVCRLSLTGAFKLLHAFDISDGAYPNAGLIDVGGTLYGTTASGGPYEAGTIFSMSPDGALSSLYSFQAGDDGAKPAAELLEYHGTLYGTTDEGGGKGEGTACEPPFGCGTVFAFTP